MRAAGWHLGKLMFYHVVAVACIRRGHVLIPRETIGWRNLRGKQLKRHMLMYIKRTEGIWISKRVKWVCRGKLVEQKTRLIICL